MQGPIRNFIRRLIASRDSMWRHAVMVLTEMCEGKQNKFNKQSDFYEELINASYVF